MNLVWTDYADILSVAADIKTKLKVQCSPPLYAIAYLERLVAQSGSAPDAKQYIR